MLLDYARFGNQSDYLSRIPKKFLDTIKVEHIVAAIKQTEKYATSYHFVGNMDEKESG